MVEHYNWKNGVNGVGVEHFKIIDGGHTWPGSNFQILVMVVLQIMILMLH